MKKRESMERRRRNLAAAELRFIRAQLEQLEMLLLAISSKTLALMAIHRSQRLKEARSAGKSTNGATKAQPEKQVSAPGAASEGLLRAAARPHPHVPLQDPQGVISTSASHGLAPPEASVGTHDLGEHDLGEHGLGEPDVDRPRAGPAD
jgi:hypothetical protein